MYRPWAHRIGFYFLILLVLINVFLYASSRWNSDRMPGILNWRILSVLTGSMAPTIEGGDMVLVVKYAKNQPRVGDIVTYWQDQAGRPPVTHRIVQRLENGLLQTQGDSNLQADGGWTDNAHIVGKVVFTIPYGATVQKFFQQPLILISLIALLFIDSYRIWRRQTKDATIQSDTVEGELT